MLSATSAGFGVSNFAVQVTDRVGNTASKSLALNIAPAPLTLVPTSVPVGTLGVPYSITFSAAGGTPPYTWFISPGALLSDLTLDRDTGVFSGTPGTARTINFGINVQDQNLVRAAMMISIQILSTLTAVNPPLPSAALGEQYTYQLNAQNGVPPYIWEISDGSVLPPGLALISPTGLIIGTPTQAGTFHFSLDLIDNGGGRLTEPLTLKVTGPSHVSSLVCTPAIVSPPGTASCAVNLTNAAGSAGLTVSLSSDNSLVTVPGTLLVPSGQSRALFTATAASISTDQTAVITAADGSARAVFSLSIAGGPLKVSTLACAPGAIPAGEKSSCIVTLSKPPSSALTVSLNTAAPILMVPGSLTIDTSHSVGTFQAVAGASLEKHMVLVTASIPGGSSVSDTVTVLATSSENPVIIAPDSVDATISSQIQFTASASDPLGRPVILSAESLPEGASFAAGAGLFQWTPSKTQTGSFDVKIKGTNSVQLTGSKDVALRVAAGNNSALQFVPVTPCRVADTRNTDGVFGGPAISGQGSRDFAVPNSACSIPATAAAYSLSISVVPHGTLGYLTLWPTGQAPPLAATMSSLDGRVKTNAAIVSAGTSGAISVFATDPTDVVLDINGYFVPTADASALDFYPVTPCRIADTRNPAGPLGAPALSAQSTRAFPIQSACGVPPDAQAYSLNFAALPKVPLGYLTAWPAGQSQPLVASLTAPTGTITASAVILPAGANGEVDVFPTDDTDLVIDINGYFAPHGPGGLSLYGLTPCRVLDTRLPAGTSAFIGSRDVNVSASGCGVPGTALAYVFNATVVPSGSLGYISMWPHGATQPLVATLNAVDGAITSNMAIVPTTDGSISVFSSNLTHLVLDIIGYFAP
jgi:large repetitive protein